MVFFCFFMNFFSFFFQCGLCRFYFVVFFFKTLWIVKIPHMVFVLLQCFLTCFFSKLSLSNIFFNIELVENSTLTFPACFCFFFFFQNCLLLLLVFFFFLFFCVFFQNMELVENSAL